MSVLEEALVARAAAVAGLTALIGSSPVRFHPVKLPQNPTLPAVTYQRISGTRESLMGADSTVARARIQLSAYSDQYSTAKAVREQLRLAFQRFRGTVSGVEILDVFLENDIDLFDEDAGLAGLHQHALDLQVIYRE